MTQDLKTIIEDLMVDSFSAIDAYANELVRLTGMDPADLEQWGEIGLAMARYNRAMNRAGDYLTLTDNPKRRAITKEPR